MLAVNSSGRIFSTPLVSSEELVGPGPEFVVVEVQGPVKFIENFIKLFKSVFRISLRHTASRDIIIRQNSPPDERDVDITEEIADRERTRGPTIGVEQEPSKKPQARAKKAGGNS